MPRSSRPRPGDFSQRFDGAHGQWTVRDRARRTAGRREELASSSCTRRRTQDAAWKPARAPSLGLICYVPGDFAQRASPLRTGLDDVTPSAIGDAERFSEDTGVATSILALT